MAHREGVRLELDARLPGVVRARLRDRSCPAGTTGLRGLPVGSRVLLILPPKLGYGQAGNPPDVGGHDTLVFVIDILAAV